MRLSRMRGLGRAAFIWPQWAISFLTDFQGLPRGSGSLWGYRRLDGRTGPQCMYVYMYMFIRICVLFEVSSIHVWVGVEDCSLNGEKCST